MLAMMTTMMIMIKQKLSRKEIQVCEQPEVVVAWPTNTTYIIYIFFFFCVNLHGRFSFGFQLCFNGLLEIIECSHFCGGGGGGEGGCIAAENGHPP